MELTTAGYFLFAQRPADEQGAGAFGRPGRGRCLPRSAQHTVVLPVRVHMAVSFAEGPAGLRYSIAVAAIAAGQLLQNRALAGKRQQLAAAEYPSEMLDPILAP